MNRMKKIEKNAGLFWLGLVVALAGLFDIVANFGDWYELFWFCPLTSALVAIGLIRRSSFLVTVCFVSVVPAQFMWFLDQIVFYKVSLDNF